ncbi:FkbM family methyltransferase [Geodermatophilus sp. CPCC 206100]|uniref:FkbM family methyltransferase n=1 Tax=Geodermatophilus sp. CPCC 206100 TaxID=3020054 RepID=UPI003B00265D
MPEGFEPPSVPDVCAGAGEHPTQAVPLHDDLVYDVGMHLGEDTAFYLRKGYRVLAFEANPDLLSHNTRRFSQEIDAGRLEILHGAISDSPGDSVSFYVHPTKTVWGTTQPQWAERNANRGESVRVEVPRVDLSAVIRSHGMPWYMKIDIEGADLFCLEVLKGFSPKPAFVSIESEKENWSRLVQEIDLLADLGFDQFAAVQQEGVHRRLRQFRGRTRSGAAFVHDFEEHSSGPFGADLQGWVDRPEVLRRYARVFAEYRLLGDESLLQRTRIGFVALKAISRVVRRPLPGWYDTHAARSDVVQLTSAE